MTKHLVLVGAGAVHVRFLAKLSSHSSHQNLKITLISRAHRYIDPQLQMGFVAGRLALEDCAAELEPLVQKTRIQWIEQQLLELDAHANALLLADGQELRYDWLSLDAEPLQLRDVIDSQIPGARNNGLFLHPTEAFCTLWPRIPLLAKTRALRVAVIADVADADADAACELAAIKLTLATATALPGSALTLITGGAALASLASESLRQRLARVFKAKKITVLQDAASSLAPNEVHLASGARLACDVPVLVTRPNAPTFLAGSGLKLTAQGFVEIDGNSRSTSHANVLSGGNGEAQAGNAPSRWCNTLIALAAQNPKLMPAQTSKRTEASQALQWIDCGQGQTLASWRQFSADGPWLTWIKNGSDRARLAQLRGK